MPKQNSLIKKLIIPFIGLMGLFPHNVYSQELQKDTISKPQTEEFLKTITENRTSIRALKNNIHESNLEPYQKLILKTAQSLDGKVKYFWGGKPHKIGIDETWGQEKKVTSKFHHTYNTMQPNGLDCSGFIAWVFETATNGNIKDEDIGISTTTLFSKSTAIEKSEVKVGDFALNKKGNHIGIVSEITPNGIKVIHASDTMGGVAETPLCFAKDKNNQKELEDATFTEFRRPNETIIKKVIDSANITQTKSFDFFLR